MTTFRQIIEAAARTDNQPSPLGNLEKRERALHALFDDGFDPNELDEHQQTALGALGSLTRGSQDELIMIGGYLVNRGANPLRHDKPLGQTIQHVYSSLLYNEVLWKLCHLEKTGIPLKDEKGGSVMHFLASTHQEEILASYIEDEPYTDEEDLYFNASMYGLLNEEGNTFLHLIWQKPPQGFDAGWMTPEPLQSRRWEITAGAVRAGVDMFQKNHLGESISSLVMHAIEEGVAMPEGATTTTVEPFLQQMELQRSTPRALSPNRSLRL